MQQNLAHMDKNLTDLQHRPRILPFSHLFFMVTNSAKKLKKVLIWYWSDNDYNCTGTVYVAFHCKLQTHIISSSCHNGKLNHAYHAIGGISLGMFFVLHGASKLPAQFLPKIPPRMVKGKPTETEKQNKTTHFSVCMNTFLYSKIIHWYQLPMAHNPSFQNCHDLWEILQPSLFYRIITHH